MCGWEQSDVLIEICYCAPVAPTRTRSKYGPEIEAASILACVNGNPRPHVVLHNELAGLFHMLAAITTRYVSHMNVMRLTVLT